jgi:hypothetical protein
VERNPRLKFPYWNYLTVRKNIKGGKFKPVFRLIFSSKIRKRPSLKKKLISALKKGNYFKMKNFEVIAAL